MANLEMLIEMRKTLTSMNESLTPYSDMREHKRYFDNLKHYKKILNTYMSRANEELDTAIEKSFDIVKKFAIDMEIKSSIR